MYDYTLDLQNKHRIEEMRRENQRRRWQRQAISDRTSGRSARDAQKPQPANPHSQYE